MPRGKKESYALADDGNGGLAPVRVTGDHPGVPSLSGLQESERRAEAAGLAFLDILRRPDGWLRIVGGDLAKSHFYKFKFSSGEWKGRYVMYVSVPGNWEEGICGLAQKLAAVDRGDLRPAYDTFYDPR